MTNIILGFQSDISTYYDEDVDIPEVTEDGREYVYYPDNHVALVDRETQEYTHYFQQDKEFQMVEEKEYILCAVDDSNGSDVTGYFGKNAEDYSIRESNYSFFEKTNLSGGDSG